MGWGGGGGEGVDNQYQYGTYIWDGGALFMIRNVFMRIRIELFTLVQIWKLRLKKFCHAICELRLRIYIFTF